jgi:hypothetical protein
MARPTKYVGDKLCNSCRLNVNYKKFRLIKLLTKGTNKGKLVGWTDINGGTRCSRCKDCEKNKANKKYRLNPRPQLIYVFKKRTKTQKVPFDLTVDTNYSPSFEGNIVIVCNKANRIKTDAAVDEIKKS